MQAIEVLLVLGAFLAFVGSLAAGVAAVFLALRQRESAQAFKAVADATIKLCSTMEAGYAAIAPVRELQEGTKKVAETLGTDLVALHQAVEDFRVSLFRGQPIRRRDVGRTVQTPTEADEAIAERNGITGETM